MGTGQPQCKTGKPSSKQKLPCWQEELFLTGYLYFYTDKLKKYVIWVVGTLPAFSRLEWCHINGMGHHSSYWKHFHDVAFLLLVSILKIVRPFLWKAGFHCIELKVALSYKWTRCLVFFMGQYCPHCSVFHTMLVCSHWASAWERDDFTHCSLFHAMLARVILRLACRGEISWTY